MSTATAEKVERNGTPEPEAEGHARLLALPVGQVIVGKRRRKDAGDLSGLKESLTRLGMLQPIGILPNKQLLYGGRRLAAAKELKWSHVPCVEIHHLENLAELFQAELDENQHRKEMLPSETLSLIREIEKHLVPAAKERQREGARHSAKARAGEAVEKGKPIHVREEIAAATGIPAQKVAKMRQIKAARKADPEKYGHLVEKMDTDGIDEAHRELEKLGGAPKKRTRLKKAPPPPDELKDARGQDVPAKLRDTFGDKFLFELRGRIEQVKDTIKLEELSAYASRKGRFFPFLDWSAVLRHIRQAEEALTIADGLVMNALPFAVCPKCEGKLKRNETCRTCRSSGYVTQAKLEELERT